MSRRTGFTEPGRHSTKVRGRDVLSAPELVKPSAGTYAVVPAAAVSDRRLGRCSPLHVLVALAKYRNADTGLCVPAIGRLATELGLKRRSVQQHINTLIECGYLVACGRRRGNGGWSSNAYTLLFPAIPDASDDDGGDGGHHPTGKDQTATSERVMPNQSDAQPSCAYPPALDTTCGDNIVIGEVPMRRQVAHGDAAELRNPCATRLRMNNSTNLNIDSNEPFAEANARARDEPESGRQAAGENAVVEHHGVPAAAEQHEAKQRVPVIQTRRAYEAPRDPLDALVKRLVKQTGVPAGHLWEQMIDWHGQIERAGLDNASAQQVLASIGRSFGHGAPSGDPIPQINARVQLWVGKREQSAA